jgi:FG-GAP-like repeat/Trypsin
MKNMLVYVGGAMVVTSVCGLTGCGAADEDGALTSEESLGTQGASLIGGTQTAARPAIGVVGPWIDGVWSHNCTATLVEAQWIATSAHCTTRDTAQNDADTRGPWNGEFWVVGDSIWPPRGKYPADRAFSFRRPLGAHVPSTDDFALVHLTTPVPADIATPISFGPAPTTGALVTAFGFGCTNRTTPTGTWNKWFAQYNFGTPSDINCPGDSGGPRLLGAHDGSGAVWAVNSGYGGVDILAPVSDLGLDGLRGVKAFGNSFAVSSTMQNFASWSRVQGVKAVTGDFNRDGFADVALVGGANWQSIPVAFGTGQAGAFNVVSRTVPQFPALAAAARNAVGGDFNGDGLTDIALLGGSGWTTIPIALSQADGSFAVTNLSTPDIPALARAPGAYAVGGDFDADGDGDIALLGGNGWNTIPVASSNRNGTFTRTNAAVSNFPGWSRLPGAKAAVGDFDGDGDADIALSGAAGWTSIAVAWSKRSGEFTASNTSVARFPSWTETADTLVAGDFDGDGDADLATLDGRQLDRATIGFAISSGRIGRFQPAEFPLADIPQRGNEARFVLPGRVDNGATVDLILVGGSGWTGVHSAMFAPIH